MIKKLLTALYADDNVLYFDEESRDAVFCCNLNNINLDDTNYDKDNPGTIIHIRILA